MVTFDDDTATCNFVGFSADSCTFEYSDVMGDTQTGSGNGSNIEFTLDSLMPNADYSYTACSIVTDSILTICVKGDFSTNPNNSK